MEELIREVLKYSKYETPGVEPDRVGKYFSAVSRLDYSSALLSQFDRNQLRHVVSELRHILPTLNEQIFSETDPNRLAKTTATFGVLLRYGSFNGPEGNTLRGFYLNDGVMIRQPIIYLNEAHDRVSSTAAFWHEMGHHLTDEIFDDRSQRLRLLSTADYHKHLTDPKEVLADVVLALAGYPKAAARKMFTGSKGERSNREIALLVAKVIHYVRSIAGFDIQRRASHYERLNVLVAMIHLAKLRSTLLNEYGI